MSFLLESGLARMVAIRETSSLAPRVRPRQIFVSDASNVQRLQRITEGASTTR